MSRRSPYYRNLKEALLFGSDEDVAKDLWGKNKYKELETYNIIPTEKIHSNIFGKSICFSTDGHHDNDIPEVIHNPQWIQAWRKRGKTPRIITNEVWKNIVVRSTSSVF